MPHWKIAHSFCSGDSVIVKGQTGVILDIFPDGIHVVKLDASEKIIVATVSELVAFLHQPNNRG